MALAAEAPKKVMAAAERKALRSTDSAFNAVLDLCTEAVGAKLAASPRSERKTKSFMVVPRTKEETSGRGNVWALGRILLVAS